MGDAIRLAVDGVGDKTDRTALFRAIGGAIVTHITANAAVSTAGTATAVQPGVGTAPTTAVGTVS